MIRKTKYEIKAEKFLKAVKEELSRDINDMINFLLFYKPKGNIDKAFHVIEVFAFWAMLTTLYIRY